MIGSRSQRRVQVLKDQRSWFSCLSQALSMPGGLCTSRAQTEQSKHSEMCQEPQKNSCRSIKAHICKMISKSLAQSLGMVKY
jgi:hypothetical protein